MAAFSRRGTWGRGASNGVSVTASLLLALACAHRAPAPEQPPGEGLLGLRFQAVAEGLVVTDVVPGMGAAQAGVSPGDLIVRIAGQAPGPDPRAQLIGTPGTSIEVTLQAPLGGGERQVSVARGLRAEPEDRAPTPEVVEAFARALERGKPEVAEEAARALVAADFGGWPALRAVVRPLRAAGPANPEAAAAAARVLVAGRPTDWDIQFIAAEALFRVDAYEEAAAGFAAVERLRPADIAGEGWRGDLGGDSLGRMFLARSLAALRRVEEADATLRALAATRTITGPLAELGLAPPLPPTETWRARQAPLPALSTTLLDGSTWSSEAHKGIPILLTFWASWCGPCMEELPHLQSLWEERKALGFEVLAVSVDDLGDRPAVERTVKRLGLAFPVTHAPELARRFEVGPIPALRLLDRGSSIRYAASGYSEAALERLRAQVDAALGEQAGAPSALGEVWAPEGVARLRAFVPVSGARDVAADAGGVVLGVAGAPPLRLDSPEALPVVGTPVTGSGGADRVAWLDGAVSAERGKPWLRAWTEEGSARWFLTTPSPVTDLAAEGGRLWASTSDEILVLDPAGAVLARKAGGAQDLAVGAGGIWAVDGEGRRWLRFSKGEVVAEDRGPAPDSAAVGAAGEVGSRIAVSLVSGRFGPQGALRVVATRDDGLIIGLDGQGKPKFILDLNGISRLAAWDADDDGQDELLVSVPDQGLAWVDVALP